MGGCCCCSSRRTEPNRTPAYYYCPRVSEEHEPLSHHGVAVSSLSTGLLVDTNLETSIPDTYRSPPIPMPYDIELGHPRTPSAIREIRATKDDSALQTTNSESVEEDIASGNTFEALTKGDDLKEKVDFEIVLPKESEIELSKSVEPIVEEEHVCPTCLEEYDDDNPKIIAKCGHHFHLACILEWKERSDTCPVCDQEMIFSPAVNG